MKESDLNNLEKQFCIGRNRTVDLSSTKFFVQKSNGNFKRYTGKLSKKIHNALNKADPENLETIDGGPNCFGDSGIKPPSASIIIIVLCCRWPSIQCEW